MSAGEDKLRVPDSLDGQEPLVFLRLPEPSLPGLVTEAVLGLAVVRVLAVSVGNIA